MPFNRLKVTIVLISLTRIFLKRISFNRAKSDKDGTIVSNIKQFIDSTRESKYFYTAIYNFLGSNCRLLQKPVVFNNTGNIMFTNISILISLPQVLRLQNSNLYETEYILFLNR